MSFELRLEALRLAVARNPKVDGGEYPKGEDVVREAEFYYAFLSRALGNAASP